MTSDNLAGVLRTRAAADGNHIAVVDAGTAVTFADLCTRAAAVAARLAPTVAPGDRVAVFLERGADAAAAVFGVLAAGGVAVVMHEVLRARQVRHILMHSGARTLLASDGLMARLPRACHRGVERVPLPSQSATASWAALPRAADDPALMLYTSGSTGWPRGVVVSHGNLRAGMDAVLTYLGLDRTDRIASLLPFAFDYGLNQLLCAVGAGATLVVERSPIPHRIVATLRDEGVTVLPAVPPLWHQLLSIPAFRQGLPALRTLTNTGGSLPRAAVDALRRAHPQARLFLMYGLTEAFRSTYLPPEDVDRKPDSIGRAIPGAEILVLGDDGRPVAPGEEGELVHRGPTVTLGYWRDPVATARVFRPDPRVGRGAGPADRVVYSGDIVRQDAEGYLYFVGRRDGLIKSMGCRVSPDEIVAVLHASGAVVEAVVTGEPDLERGTAIVAHLVLRRGATVETVAAFCRRELPRYMEPVRFVTCARLPRTSSGKYDVRAVAGRP